LTPDLRIGICGSASVGKTTLAHALARDLRLPCLSEEMRDYLEDSGSDLTSLPALQVEAILLQLWEKRKLKERTTDAFVADNCPIDFAAYALYYGCLSDRGSEPLLTAAVRNLDRYDGVVLLPWGALSYEQDGVRPSNPHLQLRYHFLLEGLLRRYVPSHKLHVLPSTLVRLDDRRRWVAARLAPTSPELRTSTRSTKPGSGMMYLVGAGPGDPKLLTLRAAELLQQADVVAYDLLVSPELLAQIPPRVELLPVGRRRGMGTVGYRLHPDAMARAKEGKVVVRLKCGDPLLFGRGGEEAEELREAGIPFEIVPGISAAFGAAAYAGFPLTHRGQASEVLFTTGHEVRMDASVGLDLQPTSLEKSHRTTVLYMAAHRLRENLERLQREGYAPTTPAALVSSATTRRQEVAVGTVATLGQRVPSFPQDVPAILIVGKVVSLRKNIQWFQTDQLRHRRILVARARQGQSRMASSLRLLGAEVVESPSVFVLPVLDPTPLDASLARLSSYDTVVLSCAPGVHAVAERLSEQGGLSVVPQTICIGEQAVEAMRIHGATPRATIPGSCAGALAQQSQLFSGKRLLLITSTEGRAQLERELAQLHAHVDSVAAYRVTHQFDEDLAANGSFDLIVLPSSSAARLLLTHASAADLRHLPAVAIGPHTKALAQQCGATRVTCAPHDDIDAVISLVVQLLVPNLPVASTFIAGCDDRARRLARPCRK
jgi:uroporphyrinogen III methyltransferase / synthase